MIGRSSVAGVKSRMSRCALTALGGAAMLVLLNESPVWGAQRVMATSTAANATGGGALLLAMGAGVLILGGGGFTVFAWSRRKRAPQPCASEREALAMAEQALRYWEGALEHLQSAARSHDGATLPGAGAEGQTRESQASLLEKAVSGRASALKVRDERQFALIQCMASGAPPTPLRNPSTPNLVPLTFETESPASPPTTFE